ncbi:hypothetical protein AAX26_01814 [Aliarcobacter thereius]|uniref:hypothetical protein n=1 Tax=Aliarcobacter thereius TaxID=544718 RepID=UPI000828B15B|nr:hypothetical protein [Aliarcobacter thereius]OCL85747.1 hypothetical protein AAX26_01814 [Aliarcobacter thereius]
MLVVPRDEVVVLSSNVPEIEYGIEVYEPGKIYTLGDVVQTEDCVFESIKDENDSAPIREQNSLAWLYKRKTNRYKVLDSYMNTSTSIDDEMIYEFAVNDIDTICFFGLIAESVKIEIFNSDDELVYEEQKTTYTRFVSNWLEWTVQPGTYKRIIFFRNVPNFYQARLKVTLSLQGGVVSCSHIVYGKSVDFGITLIDPKPTSSIRNLIAKEKNKDGIVKVSNSLIYKRVTLNILIDTSRVSEIQAFLEENSIEPMLFIGVEKDDYDCLTAFGFYKDFDQPIGLEYSQYQIEIEGIV